MLLLPLSNDGPWYHLLGPNIFWGSSWGLMGQFETDEQLEREGGHDPTSTLVPVRSLVITPPPRACRCGGRNESLLRTLDPTLCLSLTRTQPYADMLAPSSRRHSSLYHYYCPLQMLR